MSKPNKYLFPCTQCGSSEAFLIVPKIGGIDLKLYLVQCHTCKFRSTVEFWQKR